MNYKDRILIEKDENGIYIASCPALQGCCSQGVTVNEALQNLKDTIQLHIEARQAFDEPIPIERLIEEVEVVVKK